MTDHEHELDWRIDTLAVGGIEIYCMSCEKVWGWEEAEAMLNEHGWMRREIERVGRALFTGTETGYVGTEEDLHAIGQVVEGVCETSLLMMVQLKDALAEVSDDQNISG